MKAKGSLSVQMGLPLGASGTVPPELLGTGVRTGAKFLRDDGSYQALPGGGDMLAANNLADVPTPATARTNLGVLSATEVANRANARAPRGGVAFDGTAGSRVTSTLTGQNIGTDAFSLVAVFRCPSTNSGGVMYIGTQAESVGGNSAAVYLQSGNGLRIIFRSDNSNFNVADIANFAATYGGKVVTLAVVRNTSGNPSIYVNGVAQSPSFSTGGTPPTWQLSITSSHFGVGYSDGSPPPFIVHSASLYNLALSQADVTEIQELGGAVPARYQWGNKTANTSAVTNLAAGFNTFSGATASGFSAAASTSGAKNARANPGFRIAAGAQVKATFNATQNSGDIAQLKLYLTTGTAGALISDLVTVGAGANSATLTATTGSGDADGQLLFRRPNGGTDVDFTIDTLVVTPLGAVVHLPLDDGIGYQLHDASSNKLDAVMTTTGVSHLAQRDRGYVRGTLTWSGTHEAKSLLGQQALESDCVVEGVSLKPSAGTTGSGATVGTTASATRYLGTTALTTAKTYKRGSEISNGGVPGGTASTNLDLVIDPDTANYTGSIEAWVGITRTLGTP